MVFILDTGSSTGLKNYLNTPVYTDTNTQAHAHGHTYRDIHTRTHRDSDIDTDVNAHTQTLARTQTERHTHTRILVLENKNAFFLFCFGCQTLYSAVLQHDKDRAMENATPHSSSPTSTCRLSPALPHLQIYTQSNTFGMS